ncbi:unnamed protein product, partial [Ceratitis capitata]
YIIARSLVAQSLLKPTTFQVLTEGEMPAIANIKGAQPQTCRYLRLIHNTLTHQANS